MFICTVVVTMTLYSFVVIDRLRLECKFDNETWRIGGWDWRLMLVLTASSIVTQYSDFNTSTSVTYTS